MSKYFWILVVALCVAAPHAADAQQTGVEIKPTPAGLADVPSAQTTTVPSSQSGKGDPATKESSKDSIPTVILEMAIALDWFVVPFALATLIAIWFTTERLVVLRRGRVLPKPFVQRFLKLLEEGELDKDEALQICEENGSPIAQVFAHGIRKWGKASVEVEQAIIDGGERQVSGLRKHLRVINGVATITPLIGLLGTVWGMLESFNRIAEAGAMGRTDELASGISLALVTTAVGLIIAIPSLVVHMYFAGRVDALVTEMDELSQKVVMNVSAEGLAERGARPRKMKDGGDSPQKKAI
jgi:biopolymer transport protein ExbB